MGSQGGRGNKKRGGEKGGKEEKDFG